MRVTNQIIYNNLIDYLQKNNDALLEPQQQIATGHKINQPSDDPLGFSNVVTLDSVGAKLNQYLTNQNVAQGFIGVTNSALDQASKIVADVKKVALDAAAGITSQNQVYDSTLLAGDLTSLLDIANTEYQGEFIFGGFKNGTPAYNNAGVYQGDGGQIMVQIAPGATIQRNIPGQNVFGTAAGGVDIFATIQALQAAISTSNVTGVQATISSLNTAQQQILKQQGIVATRVTSLNSTRDYVKTLFETTTNLLSQTQSVDMNAAIVQLNQQMTSLQAAQAMASKIMNLSLVNFLK
jgi:flagellar hook-associated protein 3 FlgL